MVGRWRGCGGWGGGPTQSGWWGWNMPRSSSTFSTSSPSADVWQWHMGGDPVAAAGAQSGALQSRQCQPEQAEGLCDTLKISFQVRDTLMLADKPSSWCWRKTAGWRQKSISKPWQTRQRPWSSRRGRSSSPHQSSWGPTCRGGNTESLGETLERCQPHACLDARDWVLISPSHKTAKKIKVACKTFDPYKINPQDFVGCLRVKATRDGTCSISYDMHFYGVKCIVKEALSWPLCGMQVIGHMLLAPSATRSNSWTPQREGSPRAGPRLSRQPVWRYYNEGPSPWTPSQPKTRLGTQCSAGSIRLAAKELLASSYLPLPNKIVNEEAWGRTRNQAWAGQRRTKRSRPGLVCSCPT